MHLVFIMGSSPLDMSLKRVLATWITIVFNEIRSVPMWFKNDLIFSEIGRAVVQEGFIPSK